ncbi:MAG: NFACT family protein [Oscillibacter sp.]|nr:NFACT family protein [Oscillibacter sp.]
MPLDAICLRAVLHELIPQLIGARIDKVQQPARDQIVLLLRGNLRLLLNAGANQPRIQLTNILRDNPAQPPMFCMLLRKHLVGARVLSIEQPDLERMVILTLQCTDEFGEISQKQLVLECMGRRSNLVLLDAQGRIVECLRRVDADLSATRQLLPGLFYHLPTPLDKLSLLSQEEDSLALAQRGGDAEQAVDKWVLDHYTGISPLIAREFAFRAGRETDVRFGALNDTQRGALVQEFSDTANAVKEDNYMPVILYRDSKPVDFTYRPIAQYGAETQVETRESFSQMLDEFYDARERQELSARRGRELTHAVTVARDRMARKAENLKHDYAATQKRDEFRLRGDLITANLYRMKSGEKVLHAENYYEDDCPTIDIPLDPLLSPQQNAAKNYKQYNKLKTAESHLREQIEKAENERAYLESVLQELAQAETEQEFNEIRRELQETNYIRKSSGKKELKRAFAPRTFKTSSGLEVLVGRSNVQNDQLTKKADKRDYWFHTQHIHGSHVILRCAGLTPSDDDLREAAMLASYFSQAKESSSVPVDYCPVKFVKKPAGARPGMVTYDNYRTLYVTPEEGLVKKLFLR